MRIKNQLKKIDALLVEKAILSAKNRFDTWNQARFERMDTKNLTPSERNDLNFYLFGRQESTIEELQSI